MKHAVAHDLDHDTARKVARHALEGYAQQFERFDPQVVWSGADRAAVQFSAKGLTVKGQLDVRASEFVIDLEVPFLLKPFQKRAVDVVEREIEAWVAKVKRGEVID
jgi:hypothetical protein